MSRNELCASDGPLIPKFNSCDRCIQIESSDASAYSDAYRNYIEPSFGDIIRQCISLGQNVTLSLGPPQTSQVLTTATFPMMGTEIPKGTGTGTGEETVPIMQPTNPSIPVISAPATGSSIATSWLTSYSALQTNTYTLLSGKTTTITELVIATITRADWTGWSSGNRPARITGEGVTIMSIPTGVQVVPPTNSNGAATVTEGYGTVTAATVSPTGASDSGSKSVAGWVWAVVAVAIAIFVATLLASFVLLKRKRSKRARHQRSSSGSTPELPGTAGTESRTELDSEISSAELHTDKILPTELDAKVAPVEMDTEFRFELPTEYNKERDISEEAMTPLSTCTDATRIPVSPLEEQHVGHENLDEQKVLITPGLNLRSQEKPQTQHTA